MSQIIVADHLVTNSLNRPVSGAGYVVVDDGRISDVVEIGTGSHVARPSGPAVTDLGASVLMPGLVNTHAHTPMSLMRGVAEGHSLLTMEGFLATLRSREAYLTPELVGASVTVSCGEMISLGTTMFADQYFYADEIVPRVVESGLRARVAWGIVELGDDEARARELAHTEAFLAESAAGDLVRGWVGPHAFFVDNQLDAIAVEMEMARRYDIGLHAHFSTTGEEDEYCEREFGKVALAVMKEIGLLDLPLILAHATSLPADQLHFLAGTRASIAVVPSVAMMSGVTAAPVRAALDAGVNVTIGSDNPCNNTGMDLFEEMRTLGKLAAFVDQRPNSVTPAEIIRIATINGHKALGGAPADGQLSTGAVADLIALPVSALHKGPDGAQSVLSSIVYGASGNSVTHSMVAGRWLMRGRELLTVDMPSVIAAQQADYDVLVARMAAAR